MAPIILYLIIGYFVFLSKLAACGLFKTLEELSDCPQPPMECPNFNITFHLYNRRIQAYDGYQLIEYKPLTIQNAPFLRNRPVIIMSHGYNSNLHDPPAPQIIDAYNRIQAQVNIIALDWSPLCPAPCYMQSAHNTQLVGKCTATFIEVLLQQQTWINFKQIHFIGFSLGAQIASQVSRQLTIGRLPWITALDAAWPLFDPILKRRNKRLDKSDADFIDAYHTNAGEYGQLIPVGHVDFYADYALIQNGCGNNVSCNHERSVEYYAESIYTKVGFYGYKCFTILTQLTHVCQPSSSDELVLLGAYVDHSLRGTYYFTTNSHPPYAKGKYNTGQ